MSEQNQNAQNEQNEQPKSRLNLNNMAKKISGGNKTAGIIIAICMIVIGVLIFMAPLITGLGIAYLITVGFIVYGIFQIIAYARTSSDYRNGWTLANGIIFALLGILILVQALGTQLGALNMLSVFSFFIGFFALFGGITQISSYGAFKKAGEPGAGWILASGIINLVLGILIVCAPIAGWFTMEWIFAIYLIVGGIALFAEACSGKLACKK
ncbi:hypothetical protein CE91St36_01700 [Christensenellaceae bacterium]|nr:hypothetical protein CE91St36_01700 [Christensenellaceae bacterium]BDF60021.1 hypothetical protein CE91St37_01710 [Christensenellaceae bacterium]